MESVRRHSKAVGGWRVALPGRLDARELCAADGRMGLRLRRGTGLGARESARPESGRGPCRWRAHWISVSPQRAKVPRAAHRDAGSWGARDLHRLDRASARWRESESGNNPAHRVRRSTIGLTSRLRLRYVLSRMRTRRWRRCPKDGGRPSRASRCPTSLLPFIARATDAERARRRRKHGRRVVGPARSACSAASCPARDRQRRWPRRLCLAFGLIFASLIVRDFLTVLTLPTASFA